MQAWYCRPPLNLFPLNPGGEDVITLFLFYHVYFFFPPTLAGKEFLFFIFFPSDMEEIPLSGSVIHRI